MPNKHRDAEAAGRARRVLRVSFLRIPLYFSLLFACAALSSPRRSAGARCASIGAGVRALISANLRRFIAAVQMTAPIIFVSRMMPDQLQLYSKAIALASYAGISAFPRDQRLVFMRSPIAPGKPVRRFSAENRLTRPRTAAVGRLLEYSVFAHKGMR